MSLDTLKNINRTGYAVIQVKNRHRHNPNKIRCNRFESKYSQSKYNYQTKTYSLKPKALLDQFPIEAGATRAIEIAVDVDELDGEGILEQNSGKGVKLVAGDEVVIGDCGVVVNQTGVEVDLEVSISGSEEGVRAFSESGGGFSKGPGVDVGFGIHGVEEVGGVLEEMVRVSFVFLQCKVPQAVGLSI
ncbi:uncharacterized protein HKW66_Vig0249080 [Vigna angularis]|uniref:Uncharacterized protein n=1 Tax=Phaseolus angularis TaxID=3914 RepID=A0A8T0JRM1_PHAAN|nr:uncharacterized protein HKW66_Vig0249080 [Vigna angularis]